MSRIVQQCFLCSNFYYPDYKVVREPSLRGDKTITFRASVNMCPCCFPPKDKEQE